MDVAVIGPGRVGTTLALALRRAGHRIAAVGGGGPASRARFTERLAAVAAHEAPSAAARGAELVLVTTPDDAIAAVVTDLAVADALREGQRVVHVAGSQGLAPLRRAALAGAGVAACHPAQTFPAGEPDPDAIVGAAWAVTAAADDRRWAHDLVRDCGGYPHDLDEDARVLYHAALTMGSNAVGAVVAAARMLLAGAGIDVPADFLAPLVERSAAAALEGGAEAITGPVVRGDLGTVERHLEALDRDVPHLAATYRHLATVILAQVRPTLDPAAAAHLDALLDTGSRGSDPPDPG